MSDYISREQALAEVEELKKIHFDRVVVLSKVSDRIEQIPSADVRENIKGEWINAKVGKLFPSNDYKCSICGNILNFDGVNCGRGDANFCPNCGADMRGE
jgi:hypothetical protein